MGMYNTERVVLAHIRDLVVTKIFLNKNVGFPHFWAKITQNLTSFFENPENFQKSPILKSIYLEDYWTDFKFFG